jgi:hypothetical protein
LRRIEGRAVDARLAGDPAVAELDDVRDVVDVAAVVRASEYDEVVAGTGDPEVWMDGGFGYSCCIARIWSRPTMRSPDCGISST